jgi:hypothetical protein
VLQEDQTSFESAAKLWSTNGGSNGSALDDLAGPAVLKGPGAMHAPRLDAADIQICVDACGKALVLACAHSCRVSAANDGE